MSEKYDVIIIGAGIGGLVCGCYLAKAGLKVLIVEKENAVGGYCGSFKRNGFAFDIGVHYLGGIKNGCLGKILNELGIQRELAFNRFDPSDMIVMPKHVVFIRSDVNDTISGIIKSFPYEKSNIKNFFKFILDSDFVYIYSKAKKLSFKKLLNTFFRDQKLKATLEILLGNMGVSSNKASAISAILLFREFLSDSGWYPKGGVHMFPDSLAKFFKSCNGEIKLSNKVQAILTNNSKATGVILEDGEKLRARVIVSNADATLTFNKLLRIDSRERQKATELDKTPSIFAVYIGLKENAAKLAKQSATIWYATTYNIEDCYSDIDQVMDPDRRLKYLICTFPSSHDFNDANKTTVELFTAAPFGSLSNWNQYRNYLMSRMIKKAEKVIPFLKNNIEIAINATPHTFYRYTNNSEGSAYGWVPITELITKPKFLNRTSIKNLYLSGHWCNGALSQGGISQVSVSGRASAQLITQDLGLKWAYKYSVLL